MNSFRSHIKNLCVVFDRGLKTPRNNKSTQPTASCFHLFLGVWKPRSNTRTRFWFITWRPLVVKGLTTGLCSSIACRLQFIRLILLVYYIFVDGGLQGKVTLFTLSLTLSLPECLMEFCKVTLTFESVDEILWCDHSNESSLPVVTHGDICFSKFHKMKFRHLVEIAFGYIWQWKG